MVVTNSNKIYIKKILHKYIENWIKKICSDKKYRCAMQEKSISYTISQIKLNFSKNNYLFKNEIIK